MDLNLMRTLVAIYERGTVTAAAEELRLTQPSVSHALQRLRRQFHDPLFSRGRRGLAPTAFADELYGVFREALANVDTVIAEAARFDPGASTRRFRISLTDMGELGLLPQIVRALRTRAPRVELSVVPLVMQDVGEWLRFGQVDAAVASTPIRGDVESAPLFEERYQCLVPSSVELGGGGLTMEQFLEAPYAVVSASAGHSAVEVALADLGHRLRSVVTLEHFASLPRIVETCGVMAIVPSGFVRAAAVSSPLRVVELPFAVPPFTVRLYWQARRADSAQLWLRELIRSAVRGERLGDEDDRHDQNG
ncbi:MAG: LysR family transcriptional regulator [Microbacteriaceae bacterium]